MGRLRSARPRLEPLEDRRLLASISGVTFNDLNGDGLRGPGEAALAGQVVFLDTDRDGRKDAGEASATTGADGSFRFTGIQPGTYALSQLVPGGWRATEVHAAPLPPSSEADQLIRLDRLRADPRFAGLDGRGFTVAVLDTGLDASHPAFADAVVYQHDFENDDDTANDPTGHGTHVASLIASRHPDYRGVAPGASLIGLKVLNDHGGGSFSKIEEGLRWVIDHADEYGIVAVNLSLGDGGSYVTPHALHGLGDELADLDALGIVVVAAAGNNFGPATPAGVTYPAADAKVLAVGAVWAGDHGEDWEWESGAVDHQTGPDRIASFTQRGMPSQVFAPGTLLVGAAPDGGTSTLSGSSMAAAVVTGLIPLVQQAAVENLGRRLTAAEVRDLIRQSGAVIADGDDEQDNVANTARQYRRVDALSLHERLLGATSVTAGPTAASRVVHLGGDAVVTLGKRRVGSVTGVAFADANDNGVRDDGENTLASRTVFLDRNGNGRLDTGESSARTDSAGRYQFTGLPPGTYVVNLPPASGEFGRPPVRLHITDNESVRADLRAVPDLRNSAPTLTGDGLGMRLLEDALPASGLTVQQVLGSTFRDANPGTKAGMAVIAGDSANGRWQYSTDGATWQDLGAVSRNSALLLRATDRLRFVPNRDFHGRAALRYHGWDQTTGTAGRKADLGPRVGGTSAFSERTAQLLCTVSAVNDAPTVSGPVGLSINADRTAAALTVRDLMNGRTSDVDGDAMGVAVVGAEGIGRWQFSRDGHTWTDLGQASSRKARLLGPTDLVRFIPTPGWKGSARLTFRSWDRTRGAAGEVADTTLAGGPSPFSLGRLTGSITVTSKE